MLINLQETRNKGKSFTVPVNLDNIMTRKDQLVRIPGV